MKGKSLLICATLAALNLGPANAGTSEKAKIDRIAAEKVALGRVPGGKIKEGELETENGKLVWSFDIVRKSSPDVIEVQVDATTGEVVTMETETPDDQAKERAEDENDHDGKDRKEL